MSKAIGAYILTESKGLAAGPLTVAASVVLRDRILFTALLVLTCHLVLAATADFITPYSPEAMSFSDILKPPSWAHWFGTDRYGRDVLARTLFGGQITLAFGFGAVIVCLLIGLPVGLAAAYYGGWIDQLLMRVMDVLMSFPTVLLGLLILIVAGPDLSTLILAVGLVYSPRTTRVVRGAALALRDAVFIDAARARGERDTYIMLKEILPLCLGPIIVEVCIRLGYAILLGASLNYLGLGVQPPAADWGSLIFEARPQMLQAPWTAFFPILFISTLVASLHLVGDGIDAALKGNYNG
ncbi:ABC transporter permease [Aminobacter sp. J44]|uniref:ABC transporter permease n=1 Tax=Aminobacter sp. J44 TaxID=935262 RepID=UPI00119B2CEB|nr:ABC transporter permease [Aminobacter sp. J44]TWG53205.1 peptide/nickel transport system permease protein [Aminobacter sp. J44]